MLTDDLRFELEEICEENQLTIDFNFNYIYLQEWYKQRESRFNNCVKPMWKTAKGDSVAIVSRFYQG